MNDTNKTFPFMDDILGTGQRFNLTAYQTRQLALSGKIKAIRAGGKGKILINQQSVADYLNSAVLVDQSEGNGSGGIEPIPVKIGGAAR